jgi:two-component system NtrC family sensor kinase
MNRPPDDANGKPDSRWGGAGPRPPRVSPGPWHSVTVACEPPASRATDAILARSFQELARVYRHSSVGRRVLGLVHQMNTPLQVLSFQLDLLEQKAQEEGDILQGSSLAGAEKLLTLNRYCQEKLQQFRQELEKLHYLARCLAVQGAHEDAREKVALDLNEVCRQELELYLAEPFFKHRVTREVNFQEGLPLLYGHYIDFSQSFRNLMDNALEAMAGRDRRQLTVITTRRDRRLLVHIGDTGVGIPPGDLVRIFEPFFTTKRAAEGDRAGLGLFMVRRLLAPYGAEIRVDSAPGETWVSLAVPVA